MTKKIVWCNIRFRKGLYVRVIYVNVLSLHHKMKVLSTGKQNGVDGLIAPPPHIYGHQLILATICLIDLFFYDWETLCLTLFRWGGGYWNGYLSLWLGDPSSPFSLLLLIDRVGCAKFLWLISRNTGWILNHRVPYQGVIGGICL